MHDWKNGWVDLGIQEVEKTPGKDGWIQAWWLEKVITLGMAELTEMHGCLADEMEDDYEWKTNVGNERMDWLKNIWGKGE